MEEKQRSKIMIRYSIFRLIVMYLFGGATTLYGIWALRDTEDIVFKLFVIAFGILTIALHDIYITIDGDNIKCRNLFKVKYFNMDDIDVVEMRISRGVDELNIHIDYVVLNKNNKRLFSVDEYMKNKDEFMEIVQSRNIKVRRIEDL